MCGGLGVVSQELSFFLFETGSLTGTWASWLGPAGWRENLRNLPVFPPPAHYHLILFYLDDWVLNLGSHVCMVGILLTELAPQSPVLHFLKFVYSLTVLLTCMIQSGHAGPSTIFYLPHIPAILQSLLIPL